MKQCTNPDCPDLQISGDRAEYVDECRCCAACGEVLVRVGPETGRGHEGAADWRDLVPLCTPATAAELAVVESLLLAEGVEFFIHNQHFGAMKVGLSIPLYNQRTVMVAAEELERARGALELPEAAPPAEDNEHSLGDGLRMLAEALLFGWVIPRRSCRPVDDDQS